MVNFEEVKRHSSWPPTGNGMPSLDECYAANLLWQYIDATGVGTLQDEQHALVVSLARLADKGVREYRAARYCLEAFLEMSTGVASIEGHTALLRATDHLENCIDAVRRAEGYFDSRAFKDIVSEDHRAILQTLHQGLHSIRNSIQHAQDRFDQGRIPEGDPLFPAMTTDFIYFAGEIVTYAEIAALVIVVWQLASAGVLAVTSLSIPMIPDGRSDRIRTAVPMESGRGAPEAA